LAAAPYRALRLWEADAVTALIVAVGIVQLLFGFWLGCHQARTTCILKHSQPKRTPYMCPDCRVGHHKACTIDPWLADNDCDCPAPDHCLHLGSGWNNERDDWICDGCGWGREGIGRVIRGVE
jgi:hypothetical protein